MTAERLNSRERRALLFGGSVIALLLAVTQGVPAWRVWVQAARTTAARSTNELALAQQSVRRLAQTRDSLVARRRRLQDLKQHLLPGESPAAAAGVLASLVSEAADAAEVSMGGVRLRAASAGASRYIPVSVTADATADIHGLMMLLSFLEGDSALVVVSSLSVSQPEPGLSSDRPEMLRLEFSVEGLARVPHVDELP